MQHKFIQLAAPLLTPNPFSRTHDGSCWVFEPGFCYTTRPEDSTLMGSPWLSLTVYFIIGYASRCCLSQRPYLRYIVKPHCEHVTSSIWIRSFVRRLALLYHATPIPKDGLSSGVARYSKYFIGSTSFMKRACNMFRRHHMSPNRVLPQRHWQASQKHYRGKQRVFISSEPLTENMEPCLKYLAITVLTSTLADWEKYSVRRTPSLCA